MDLTTRSSPSDEQQIAPFEFGHDFIAEFVKPLTVISFKRVRSGRDLNCNNQNVSTNVYRGRIAQNLK